MAVQRQYYNSTFNPPDSGGVVDGQTFIYASDRGVALASAGGADNDPVTGLTSDGTYYVDYFFTGGTVDSQNAGYLREFRLTRSGGVITVETRSPFEPSWQFQGSGSGSSVSLAPSMDVAVYCAYISSLSGGVDGMESKVPGTWTVARSITGPLGPSGPTNVRSFTMRLLALKNVRAEKPKFDPKSDENSTVIKGDVIALPVGWQPTADVPARIDIVAFGPIPVTYVELTMALLPSIGPLGEVAEFEIAWDGTVPGKDEPAEGVFQVQARVIADTPVIGTTKSVSKEVFVNVACCTCKCDKTASGSSKVSVDISCMPTSPVGPSFDLNMDYCTASSAKPPGSMGFGWQGKSSSRVFEPAGQNGALAYRSESGSFLRWNLVGSDYVPAFANN